MDIKAFLDRTNRSKADLLRELGLDPKSSLISAYISGRSRPSFDVVDKLIELGITAEELFGKEHADILIRNSTTINPGAFPKKLFDTPEFKEEVAKALAELNAEGKIR